MVYVSFSCSFSMFSMVYVSLCQFICSSCCSCSQLCSSCHVVSGFSFAKKKILKEKASRSPIFGRQIWPILQCNPQLIDHNLAPFWPGFWPVYSRISQLNHRIPASADPQLQQLQPKVGVKVFGRFGSIWSRFGSIWSRLHWISTNSRFWPDLDLVY